ncbi:MAG: glycoside hydrolase family 43 protein [Treponemataceae bacterium]|nr:glycoside hydrolase family 43 protein [Treponemataceae bacterium]
MFSNLFSKSVKLSKMQKLIAENAFKMPNENNPIMTHKCGADPAVLEYGDTLYVYSTNDMQQLEYTNGKIDNGYTKITSLNVFSTKDLVNWTDCGEIPVAGKNGGKGDAKWASNSWAPAIACKKINGKDKFFLYFADSANGIGVLTADSPVGPFKDPLGKALISRDTPTCKTINWLFDPAVLVDDKGNGYLYFGGGHDKDKYEHPKNARCVALTDDMIGIKDEPIMMDPPFLFEDSGINKIGDTYYYTYCTNWEDRKDTKDPDKMPIAVIGYMTSKYPLGPFEYKGYTLENPGTIWGVWGNNHHWIFQFKNKWYIAYHTQTLEKDFGIEKSGYRNLFIDYFEVNADGSLPNQKMTKTGVEQVGSFNPYEKIPGATFAAIKNIAVSNKQTAVAVKDGAYICIKGVDLSNGAASIALSCSAPKIASIKIQLDDFSAGGTVIGEAAVVKKNKTDAKLELPENMKGKHDLYFILSEGVELVDWTINK